MNLQTTRLKIHVAEPYCTQSRLEAMKKRRPPSHLVIAENRDDNLVREHSSVLNHVVHHLLRNIPQHRRCEQAVVAWWTQNRMTQVGHKIFCWCVRVSKLKATLR